MAVIKGYHLFLKLGGAEGNGEKITTTPVALPYTMEGLSSDTDYIITAKAVDTAGRESVFSNPLAASTLTYPVGGGGELTSDDYLALDAIATDYLARNQSSAVSFKFTSPRGDYAKAFGTDGYRAITLDDHFRIGSISKTFTATAIFQQIDAGRLTLDDTLDMFLPDILARMPNRSYWPGGTIANSDRITVRHMLMMRSGIFDYTMDSAYGIAITLFPTAQTFTRDWLLGQVESHGSLFEPGAQYFYCNTNYLLLGLIVEAVTGRGVHDLIREDICVPLGMLETSRPNGSTIPAPSIHGYENQPIWGANYDITAVWAPAFDSCGDMVSTLGDLNKWAEELRDNTLLTPETHALRKEQFSVVRQLDVFTPPVLGFVPDYYGYGLGLLAVGEDWYGHDGSIPGFSSICLYDENTKTTFTAMENYQSTNLGVFTDMWALMAEYLYPGSVTTEHVYPRYLPSIPSAEKFGRVGVGPMPVVFDGTGGTGHGWSKTLTWTQGVAQLVETADVFVDVIVSSGTTTGVTCDGEAMTSIGTNGWLSRWHLAQVPTGRKTFVATASAYGGMEACSRSFYDVKTVSAAATTSGTGLALSQTVTLTDSTQHLALQAFGGWNSSANGANILTPAGGTNRYLDHDGWRTALCASDATETTTFTATGTPSYWGGWVGLAHILTSVTG